MVLDPYNNYLFTMELRPNLFIAVYSHSHSHLNNLIGTINQWPNRQMIYDFLKNSLDFLSEDDKIGHCKIIYYLTNHT